MRRRRPGSTGDKVTQAEARAGLRKIIEGAFSDVPCPGDNAIVSHQCWECDETVRAFKGKRWQDYRNRPLDLVGIPNRDKFPLLTPEAFRYYVPLAMLAAVDFYEECDVLSDTVVFHLDPAAETLAGKYEARLSSFPAAELRVLLSFLQYMKEWHPADYGEGPGKTKLESAMTSVQERLNDLEKR